LGIKLVGADIQRAALTPYLQQFRPGHVASNIRAYQAVDIEITVVAEDDAPARIRHHHALAEIVQRGADESAAPQWRTLDPAQRRQHPQPGRGREGHGNDAADQELPDHVGIEVPDLAGGLKAARRRWRGPDRSA